MAATGTIQRARRLLGLLLVGQGLLVATRILDHEAPLALGLVAIVAGAALLLWPARGDALATPRRATLRRRLVLALGIVAAGGVLVYELVARNGLAAPEVAILLYGLALCAVSTRLERRVGPTDVGALVAYSFPLVLAPLALFAVNAAVTTSAGSTPLAWYIRNLLVAPMALALRAGGIEVASFGDTVRLATPQGALFLTVGVVCAGLYASVLFLGVFALFAWERQTSGVRLALYLALGVAGLHVANVLRLVLLAYVGYAWGGDALQRFHQHAGWVLFLAWSVLFWWLVLRRFEGDAQSRATV